MVAMSGDLLMFTFFVFYRLFDVFLIWGRSQLYSRETSFLFQRLSMIMQRFNSALITDSCFSDEDPDL